MSPAARAPQRWRRRLLWSAALVLGAALVAGALDIFGTSREPARPEGSRARAAPGAQSGAPGSPASMTGGLGLAPPTPAPAGGAMQPAPEDPRSADERQLAKIERGLGVDPQGKLRVTGIPAGSVVGLLELRPGDVIVAVNGAAVATPDDFARIYREQGLPSELTLIRAGQEIHRRR